MRRLGRIGVRIEKIEVGWGGCGDVRGCEQSLYADTWGGGKGHEGMERGGIW